MSQFRKTPGIYVSQWGGDNLNAGTDALLPKKDTTPYEPQASSALLLGSGYYDYSQQNTSGGSTFTGDGKTVVNCIMLPNPTSLLASKAFVAKDLILTGRPQYGVLSVENCVIYCEAQADIYMRTTGSSSISQIKVKSVFKGKIRFIGGFSFSMMNCIVDLDNDSLESNYTATTNAPAANAIGFSYNYWSKQTPVFIAKPASSLYANLTVYVNNLINCPILVTSIDSVKREAKFLIDGSPRPDANGALPDIAEIWPEFYLQGNFASSESDIKIIDLFSKTVEQGSILLQKSNVHGFIGGVTIGKKIDLDESGFTITKTGIDDSNPNFWKIATGIDYAKIRITGKVSDSLISAQVLDIRIPFNFDGGTAGGTSTNNNVPDAWNARTTPDTKGDLPNRLTFEVRSSKLTNPSRDVSADWDNDNTNSPSIAGRYYLHEFGQPMLHHIISAVAYGNADLNAINASVKIPFNYRSLDIIITITNTRVI